MQDFPRVTDPALAKTPAEYQVLSLVFDSLYRQSTRGVVDNIASGPVEWDESRTLVSIPIETIVRTHGGALISADDVAASLERSSKVVGSPIRSLVRARPSKDGQSVELKFSYPPQNLPLRLSTLQTSIAKKGAGSGPFAVAETSEANRTLSMKTHKNYHGGRAFVEGVTFWSPAAEGAEAKAFEEGRLMISGRGVTAFAGRKPRYETRAVSAESSRLVYMRFGAQSQVWQNKGLRLALSAALHQRSLARVDPFQPLVDTLLPFDRELVTKSEAKRLSKSLRGDARGRTELLSKLEGRQIFLVVRKGQMTHKRIAAQLADALHRLGLRSAIVERVNLRSSLKEASSPSDAIFIEEAVVDNRMLELAYARVFALAKDTSLDAKLQKRAVSKAEMHRLYRARLPIVPLAFVRPRFDVRKNLGGVRYDPMNGFDFANVDFGEVARER